MSDETQRIMDSRSGSAGDGVNPEHIELIEQLMGWVGRRSTDAVT